MAKTPIRMGYGFLCWMGDQRFLSRNSSGAWELHEEPFGRHLYALANAGVDNLRFLLHEPWTGEDEGRPLEDIFTPFVFDTEKQSWDILTYNDYYRPIVRRAMKIMKRYGIDPRICLLDMCGFHHINGHNFEARNPWINNIQRIGHYGIFKKENYEIFETYCNKMMDWFLDLDPLVSWGNETIRPEFRGLAKNVIHKLIRERNLDPMRMTYGAVFQPGEYVNGKYVHEKTGTLGFLKADLEDAFGAYYKLAVVREVHGCGSQFKPPNNMDDALACLGKQGGSPDAEIIRLEFSSDGVDDGLSPNDVNLKQGKRRPSPEQMARMTDILFNYRLKGKAGGKVIDQAIWIEHNPKAVKTEIQVPVFQAISEVVKRRTGSYPEQWQKYEYSPLPTDEDSPPEPPKPPDPPKPKKCKCYYWLTEPKRPDIWRWLKCLFGGKKRCK